MWFKKSHMFRLISTIPDFGVSTAILNPAEIFRRWCKLNFGLLRGHVEHVISLPFYWKDRREETIVLPLNVLLGITGKEQHWATLLDTDSDLLLSFKRNWRLDLDLDNSFRIQRILYFCYLTTLKFGFPHNIWSREIELDCIGLFLWI